MTTEAKKSALNVPLKIAIVSTLKAQGDIAMLAGIRETRLSKIVTGRLEPTAQEQKALAAVLDKPVEELFQHEQAAV